jgi:hypothetical protein
MGRPLGPLDVDPGRPYRESAAGDVLECPRRRHLPRPRGHSPPVTVSDASLPRDSPASAPQRSFCTSTLGCRQAPDAPFWRYPHGATARRSGADDLCSCSGAFRVFAECARSAVSSTDQRNTGLFGEALLSWLTLAMDERQKLAVDPPSPKTECPPRPHATRRKRTDRSIGVPPSRRSVTSSGGVPAAGYGELVWYTAFRLATHEIADFVAPRAHGRPA